MSIAKRILAIALALVLAFALASCGKKSSSSSATKTTAAPKTDESGNIIETESTLPGESVATTISGNGGGNDDKNSGRPGTTKDNSPPVKPTEIPGHSTIAPEIPRTVNSKGNPTDSFIKSLKGYKLKVFNPWPGAAEGTPIYESAHFVERTVEDRYGVTIEETGKFAGYAENVQIALQNGRPEAHIYLVQDMNFPSYLDNNYLANLSEGMRVSGVDMKEPWYDQSARKFFNLNYNQYAWIGSDNDPYLIYYNKKYIREKKLTDPATLAAQGKWTWDMMKSYSEKLKTADRSGLAGSDSVKFLEAMAASNGLSVVNATAGTSPKSNIRSAGIKDILSKIAAWSRNNAVINFYSDSSWDTAYKQFAAGKAAMIHSKGDVLERVRAGSSFKSDVGVVSFPKGPNGSYTNVMTTQFISFVPRMYEKEAGKILFIRNEMMRQSYRFWDRDFQVRIKDIFPVGSAEMKMYSDLKFAKNGYKTKYDWVGVSEKTGGNTSTKWIVDQVISQAKTPQQVIDAEADKLDILYKDVWKDYIIRGK